MITGENVTVDGQEYLVVDGTYYGAKTPLRVIDWLETARKRGQRIRIFYGDSDTGKDWLSEYFTVGTVGRSMGKIKIPLMINNSRSMGGDAIMTENIVKITVDKKVVYQHPKYNMPQLVTEYNREDNFRVWDSMTDEIIASFDNREKASNWVLFMNGLRNRK